MLKPNAAPPDPSRFTVAKGTLRFDRFMTHFIKVGGIGVILAVFGIFAFIAWQVFPLFRGARVKPLASVPFSVKDPVAAGIDEWAELPFLLTRNGAFHFAALDRDQDGALRINPDGTAKLDPRGRFTLVPEFPESPAPRFTAFRYEQGSNRVLLGTADGRFTLVKVLYTPDFSEKEKRRILVSLKTEKLLPLGTPGARVLALDEHDAEDRRLVAGILETAPGTRELRATAFKAKRTLIGEPQMRKVGDFDLTPQLDGHPIEVLVSGLGDALVVATNTGSVQLFRQTDDGFQLSQTFKPFADLADPALASLDFVLGDVSLVVTSRTGENRIFSMARDEPAGALQYVRVKDLPALNGPATFFARSERNRAFLVGSGTEASLRYGTTASIRWEKTLSYAPDFALIAPKFDHLLFTEKAGRMHLFSLDDPHPEAGFRAFFGKIWYEGQNEPTYTWQSTGATDDFEPKLSMVPLIFGTLKGTFYAMLFAIPVALLAAIYTSQFLKPELKKIVKPTMEIMASLPSVVLGFLGALWLAPLLEARIPSVLLILTLIPLSALLMGWLWGYLPQHLRLLIRPGYEFLVFIPLVALVGWVAWELGPVLERTLFTVPDPVSGAPVADFRLWWPHVTGLPFEQRNSLVVGFMMGFAVIPIIFTIAEDSMTNVPTYLTSASLALGASRWQTAWRIVLPTASPGIFSALMIGLGRAVGETMIVVMATGNTPVMEGNIFNGMRTLSANIAVELPEAPVDSTLYRTLFLGGMVLFLLTFAVNTVAELTRQRLREKYKTVG